MAKKSNRSVKIFFRDDPIAAAKLKQSADSLGIGVSKFVRLAIRTPLNIRLAPARAKEIYESKQ